MWISGSSTIRTPMDASVSHNDKVPLNPNALMVARNLVGYSVSKNLINPMKYSVSMSTSTPNEDSVSDQAWNPK